jgi:hypothetical protein
MNYAKKIFIFLTTTTFLVNIYSFTLAGAATESEAEFANRIAIYEKEYPVSLTQEENQLLVERCALIQNKIIEARDIVNETIVSREASYGNIERKLAAIQSRLSGQGLDTSVIDLMLASYRIEVSNFKTSAERYGSTLNDASAINCQKNPVAFKSTVLAIRDKRQLPVNSMKRIRDLYTSSFMSGFEILGNQLNEK